MTALPELDLARLLAIIEEEVAAARRQPADLASVIDHTLLTPEATADDIERLCLEATQHGFRTVCVNPIWVSAAADRLRQTGVGISAVVGFPLGASTTTIKAGEARQAIREGATEVDMVMAIGLVRSGDFLGVAEDVYAVAEICRGPGVECKAIIEAAYLGDKEKVAACVIAEAAGATFVKTSTGFGPGGATAADVALMRRVVGPRLGVKAAGGIRDLATAKAMLAAGATRIGTSAGVRIVSELRGSASSGFRDARGGDRGPLD